MASNFEAPVTTAGFQPAPSGGQPPLNLAGEPFGPQFDAIEKLPEGRSQDRLRTLRQRAEDARSLIPVFEDVRTASLAKQEAQNALTRLTSHPQSGGFNLKDDHPSVRQATRTLEQAEAAFARIKERQTARSTVWRDVAQALQAVEGWLRHDVRGVLEQFETELPGLARGETIGDAVERYRRRGRELVADLRRLTAAPYPSGYAKERMMAEIEALSLRGTPDVSGIVEHDAALVWPSLRQQSEIIGPQRGLAFGETVDVAGVIAFLWKDQLITALAKEIDEVADDENAMSHGQRKERETELQGDLLACERIECELTWQAQSEGVAIEFRADVSPQAILGVKVAPAAPPLPVESSWRQSFEIFRPGGGR